MTPVINNEAFWREARKKLAAYLHKRGWAYDVDRNGLRRRLYCLVMEGHPWWDWGHHLMVIVGRDWGGNWDDPRPETWWYKRGPSKPMWRTKYPRHGVKSFTVLTEWEAMRGATEGLNEDEMYEWQAIGVNQDGDLHLGHQYWGGAFHELRRDEWPLLRRWLRHAHRRDWYGLRSWLYAQGLHAAVHRKKPWTCQTQPPPGQGGYDHWYCQLPRNHDGMHRFNNYRWGDVGGETVGAWFHPHPDGAA